MLRDIQQTASSFLLADLWSASGIGFPAEPCGGGDPDNCIREIFALAQSGSIDKRFVVVGRRNVKRSSNSCHAHWTLHLCVEAPLPCDLLQMLYSELTPVSPFRATLRQ
jgi:hypothetical protein